MNREEALKLSHKTYFLMQCQERTGVQFNIEGAQKLYGYCCNRMCEIEREIEPHLPQKELNKGELDEWTPPKIQLKNSKEGLIPSAHAEKWFDGFEQYGDDIYGIKDGEKVLLPHNEPLKTTGPMHLKDQGALKDWLMTLGWRPTLWNFKKDPKGKLLRADNGKPIKTTPKLHEYGNICPHLEELSHIKFIPEIIEWLSLRNRRSVIWNPDKNSGWLALERDRLPAGSHGITNTHRQRHAVVANIPRTTSVLGEEMRSLFTVAPGMAMVGYDASSLEAMLKGHYAYKYEGGKEYYEKITHPDYDEHQETADSWGLESRQDAKPGNYGLQYNQGPSGLAAVYSIPIEEAQRRWELYWENNKPYKLFLENLERHWESRGRQSIHCYTTGHDILVNTAHVLGSWTIQHTGAIVMDLAGAFMDSWLGGIKYENNIPVYKYRGKTAKRVIYYHDEYAWECEPEIAHEIGMLGTKSIRKAGEFLKLNVPLDAEFITGESWADVH